jgi:hypothetical protein
VELPDGYEIEVLGEGVRGGTETADAVMAFWAKHNAVTPADVPGRLPFVICVLWGPDGQLAATASAREADVAPLGSRRFWVYRCLAPGAEARACVEAMAKASRQMLAERPGATDVKPVGLCFPIADRQLTAERDEAFWRDAKLMYAGWTDAGEQLRVSYFDDARIL